MHNAGFDAAGLNFRYVAFEPKDIGGAMAAVRALDLVGVSVSKPYKEAVLDHLDELDDVAARIGAVNVVHNTDGHLKGYNSDWIGAVEALKEQTPISAKRVTVIGAGGASRAIVYGLCLDGAEVTVVNRSKLRGETLAKEFGVKWGGGLDSIAKHAPQIIINATPVGHHDDLSPIEIGALAGAEVVMDINVRSRSSQLLTQARDAGLTTVGGVRMLVLQGVFTWELFTGAKAPTDAMQAAVEEALLQK